MAGNTVSVIMSAFNCGRYLSQAIASIQSQTRPPEEFIVVDDASTDGTQEILKSYQRGNVPVTVLRNETNQGLTRSLKRAIQHCSGKYIARQDADDWSHPKRLERQIAYLDKYPETGLLGTGGYVFNEKDELIEMTKRPPANLRKVLKRRNYFFHGSVVFLRTAYEEVGGYDERFSFAQDYDLFLRIAEIYPVQILEQHLYYYRLRMGSISVSQVRKQILDMMVAQRASVIRAGVSFENVGGDVVEQAKRSLHNQLDIRRLESNVGLAQGKLHYINKRKGEARKAFLTALIAFPRPSTCFHYLKTFF